MYIQIILTCLYCACALHLCWFIYVSDNLMDYMDLFHSIKKFSCVHWAHMFKLFTYTILHIHQGGFQIFWRQSIFLPGDCGCLEKNLWSGPGSSFYETPLFVSTICFILFIDSNHIFKVWNKIFIVLMSIHLPFRIIPVKTCQIIYRRGS